MINYIVENFDELIKEMRNAGVAVDDRIEEHEHGRFAWAMDR
jgi:hypothetical protein